MQLAVSQQSSVRSNYRAYTITTTVRRPPPPVQDTQNVYLCWEWNAEQTSNNNF